MKSNFTSWFVGFLFSIGLGVSGMTKPIKIWGFLDVFGDWDPSLAFVMAGSILIHFFAFKFILRRNKPVLSNVWHITQKNKITPSLALGSIIFGVGWGLGGYCPGPAITSLASLQLRPTLFVLSMLVGMFIFRTLDKQLKFNR